MSGEIREATVTQRLSEEIREATVTQRMSEEIREATVIEREKKRERPNSMPLSVFSTDFMNRQKKGETQSVATWIERVKASSQLKRRLCLVQQKPQTTNFNWKLENKEEIGSTNLIKGER
ncbi:hypothetical protein H6P81_020221 [Aristolochia fimbriata]|uniref:Uncharacterized protein n=1 Tax=Aristolochia fimbriata TaxID=158543 RepID=A0AAV7DWU1_ARIFI|nr:hypothetical protein H6P81_020221 [Aristolochia fimbriata]